MLRVHFRILLISIVSLCVTAPAVFGQQDTETKTEKKASSTEVSSKTPEVGLKLKEKKPVFRSALSRSTTSSVYAPDDKSKTVASSTDTPAPQEDAAALAKKLSNPVSSLISLPFVNTFDFGMGPNGDGYRYSLNVQPVIPVSLSKDWNLISRTIIPIMGQHNVVAPGSTQFGLGDVTQAFFFSPNKTDPVIWAIGPQLMIPTATNSYLGTKKLSLGPTFLILKQQGPWSVGSLVGHFWSVAGSSSRPSFSTTNFQPFISYGTKSAWTFTLNTESTYDWQAKQWSIPLHLVVAKLVRFGKQPVSIGGTLRCWAASGPTGPEGCGFRLAVTPLFPRKG